MVLFFSDDLPAGQPPRIFGVRLSFPSTGARTDALKGSAEGSVWRTRAVYHSNGTKGDNKLSGCVFINGQAARNRPTTKLWLSAACFFAYANINISSVGK